MTPADEITFRPNMSFLSREDKEKIHRAVLKILGEIGMKVNHDEALVITGRWPDCRFGNVCLWNRFQQTFDYVSRTVSLNRTQTEADEDGRFTMILAHEDPGRPNWLDTEGNPFGLVFWRFLLVEGGVETPNARVAKLADVRR